MLAPDSINRVAKMWMDDGSVSSYDEALEKLRGFRIGLSVGREVTHSRPLQAALLTAVATTTRYCHGGVYVAGLESRPGTTNCSAVTNVSQLVADLGGSLVERLPEDAPCLAFGTIDTMANRIGLQVTFDGWRAGVLPLEDRARLPESGMMTPAGVAAGALAASELFQLFRGREVACQRQLGLSLWRPETSSRWKDEDKSEPQVTHLPANYWLIGLGHLGQAYAWTISLLPYPTCEKARMVVQDADHVTEANESTGLLSSVAVRGFRKTRLMANWLEQQSFLDVAIVERRFKNDFKIQDDEPLLALCGVDNMDSRRMLEHPGFARIVEAGLGNTADDALKIRVHSFPGTRTARHVFEETADCAATERHLQRTRSQPAYRSMEAGQQLDGCGLDQLAGVSVGIPFVGATASALVIAESIRMAMGEQHHDVIDVNLASPEAARAVLAPPAAPTNIGRIAVVP
ncbi:MAG: hypothetical protein ACRDFX_06030 [Chloroflexota bacterium]